MNRISLIALACAGAAVLSAGSFYLGRSGFAHDATSAAAAPKGASAPARQVLYWHDPMVPGQRFDKPGKSPFMDMQLQPVYADEAADASASGVRVSATVQQNLGLRTATVRRAEVTSSLDSVGTVAFDERLSAVVQPRVAGYVERLLVRAPMERVARGQALASVYAPDWLGALNELAALKRAGVGAEIVAAARERTRALSIPAQLVQQAEEGGPVSARYTLAAPMDGVVAELGVREGAAVTPGMTLFRLAGTSRVWVVAEVPEAHAPRLNRGQRVKAVLQADPTQTVVGSLAEILPQVNPTTRTVQARFEVDNKAGRLVPGMLVRLQLEGATVSRLLVPAEAVLRTGIRSVVIVRKDGGVFEPRDVQLGADMGDELEVVSGLAEGEQVVASGQFLVDSEARLRSVLGSLSAAAVSPSAASQAAASQAAASHTAGSHAPTLPASQAAASTTFEAQGKVEEVDADSVTITHGALPELKWPPMTMGFGKPSPTAFPELKPGDQVHFEFKKGGALGYELVSVHRLGGAR